MERRHLLPNDLKSMKLPSQTDQEGTQLLLHTDQEDTQLLLHTDQEDTQLSLHTEDITQLLVIATLTWFHTTIMFQLSIQLTDWCPVIVLCIK